MRVYCLHPELEGIVEMDKLDSVTSKITDSTHASYRCSYCKKEITVVV